ncbi:hypothetical protein GDO81_020508 [Engystomops pustulosus]|uniref:Prolactin receptor n=1 Tax=Engystomops pustulosus TaxID=76066 RepID=A0AAV6YX65_ENGPU|nr:hypothetical protein GDO81_020508 [Engystomops pustulosus]
MQPEDEECGRPGRGTKWDILEKRSVTTQMTVLPEDTGRQVTKSIATWNHGGLGSGNGSSSPAGLRQEALLQAQEQQDPTNSRTSLTRFGH